MEASERAGSPDRRPSALSDEENLLLPVDGLRGCGRSEPQVDVGQEHTAHVADQAGEVGRVTAQLTGEHLPDRLRARHSPAEEAVRSRSKLNCWLGPCLIHWMIGAPASSKNPVTSCLSECRASMGPGVFEIVSAVVSFFRMGGGAGYGMTVSAKTKRPVVTSGSSEVRRSNSLTTMRY